MLIFVTLARRNDTRALSLTFERRLRGGASASGQVGRGATHGPLDTRADGRTDCGTQRSGGRLGGQKNESKRNPRGGQPTPTRTAGFCEWPGRSTGEACRPGWTKTHLAHTREGRGDANPPQQLSTLRGAIEPNAGAQGMAAGWGDGATRVAAGRRRGAGRPSSRGDRQ